MKISDEKGKKHRRESLAAGGVSGATAAGAPGADRQVVESIVAKMYSTGAAVSATGSGKTIMALNTAYLISYLGGGHH